MPRPRHRVLRILRVKIKRMGRGLDRETPEWMRWLTPWGTSLAFHAVLLLAMAILFRAMGSDVAPAPVPAFESNQLGEDIASLRAADRGGDPFTKSVTDDAPSISFVAQPAPSAEVVAPRLPPSFAIGPELVVTPHEIGSGQAIPSAKGTSKKAAPRAGAEGSGAFADNAPRTAPFSGRSAEVKAQLIRREGGTAQSEKAVERGLDWIARHQRPDGAWSLDTVPMCQGAPCPDAPCVYSDTGATGLALLPLLGAGYSHTQKSRYQATIQRGLAWLLKNQKSSGELWTGGGAHTLYYSHAIATMAICEAYGLTGDKRLRDPAQKAITYIHRSQNRFDGGWRYVLGEPSDTSVFGWQIFALRSAHLAGLEVNKAVLKRSRDYLDLVSTDSARTSYGYMQGTPWTPSMTAESLVCRQLLGWSREHPSMVVGTAGIYAHLEQSQQRSIYYWYYATQLLHNMKGKEWEQWNRHIREGLISEQVGGEACDRGSWSPVDPQPDLWGSRGGRLYQTSLSILTLEVYYRYLPLYKDRGGDGGETEPIPPAEAKVEAK